MNPWILYDRLIELADPEDTVAEVHAGPSWLKVRSAKGRLGVASVCGGVFQNTEGISGLPLREAAKLLKSWSFAEASVGMAALNACLNAEERFPPDDNPDAFLRYRSLCENKRVAVVGHFAYLETRLQGLCDLYVLERAPSGTDYPDPACEYLLPEMDVVFLTGSAVTNKTMPRLLQLSSNAFTVLSGPSTPMTPILFEYGADALCGFCVTDSAKCDRAVADQAGIFACGRMVCLEKEENR